MILSIFVEDIKKNRLVLNHISYCEQIAILKLFKINVFLYGIMFFFSYCACTYNRVRVVVEKVTSCEGLHSIICQRKEAKTVFFGCQGFRNAAMT